MLVELMVENFAVVERLRLRLEPGLNTLTGETGSGKSLVVDALGLLLGGRASTEMIRTGEARAHVSGIFEMPADPGLRARLDEAGITTEDDELLIEREILANGKSRAFVASRPVTAAFLKELAPAFGDIHGQHDQQRLFLPDSQRELLDEAAGDASALEETARLYAEWQAALVDLREVERVEQDRLRLADLWTMQRREIEPLQLEPGEDARLENERRVLRNVAKLSEFASAAYDALSEAEPSVVSGLGLAVKRLDEIARIDASLAPMVEALRPAQIAAQEAARDLADYIERLEADPRRLEEVETRLARLEKLKRKYGSTIEEILAFLDDITTKLNALENAGERRAELAAKIAKLEAAYTESAAKLRVLRQKAARKLEKQVKSELARVAMAGSEFRITLQTAPPAAHGSDAVEFLVSANVGEEARPLEKVASGGELSRIALALKTCIAPSAAPGVTRTIVFDEVDAGVGGAAGEAIGRRLRAIAEANQVLCVTHLPQIAACAAHHYRVSKHETNGRTVATVEALDEAARVREIGRMLSGQTLTNEALRHAERLIAEAAAPGRHR
jgi:DNA repair protein RecN (Recombination protein N)